MNRRELQNIINDIWQWLQFDDTKGSFYYDAQTVRTHLDNCAELFQTFLKLTDNLDTLTASDHHSFRYRSRQIMIALFNLTAVTYLLTKHTSLSVPISTHLLGILTVFFALFALIFYRWERAGVPVFEKSLLYVRDLTLEGWTISTFDNPELYEKWSSKYDFFLSGDKDKKIDVRIYGNYLGYDFCYFEYTYSVKHEETVIMTDDEGETYFETEVTYKPHRDSGLFIDSGIETEFEFFNLPDENTGVNFSHIAFANRFSVLGSQDDITLRRLFNPKNRLALLETSGMFLYTKSFANSDGILSVFYHDDGLCLDDAVDMESFAHREIVYFIKSYLAGPVKFLQIINKTVTSEYTA